jgi:hypothetical protein
MEFLVNCVHLRILESITIGGLLYSLFSGKI